MDIVTGLNYVIVFFSVYVTVFFLLLYLRYRNEYYNQPSETNWSPKVSVIIPAYNEEKYLADCLKTVLELDYPKEQLEIIVVDDGSTDKTAELAKGFEKQGVTV